MSSLPREYTYSDILSDEDKSWEEEHRLILKKAFQDAAEAVERDDRGLALSYLESAFSKMGDMKKRLVISPILWPGAAYEPWNEAFGAKQLCKLYLQEGRHDSAINFASKCFSGASSAFFQYPHLAWFKPEVHGKYIIFQFWGEALGNFYCETGQEYMARHLWETILNDLRSVNWDKVGQAHDEKLREEQGLWHRKISRLKPEDAELE